MGFLCLTWLGAGTANVSRLMAEGEAHVVVCRLLDLVCERDRKVGAGDVRVAVAIGDQDIGARAESAGQ
jgi:hypothetical protein